MADTTFVGFEATEADSEALADIIWFIKCRLSACADQGRSCELDSRHLEALRRFRCDMPKRDELRNRCHAAEQREKLTKHFAALPKKCKK